MLSKDLKINNWYDLFSSEITLNHDYAIYITDIIKPTVKYGLYEITYNAVDIITFESQRNIKRYYAQDYMTEYRKIENINLIDKLNGIIESQIFI